MARVLFPSRGQSEDRSLSEFAASCHGLFIRNFAGEPCGNSNAICGSISIVCGRSVGFLSVRIAFLCDHAAHPYASNKFGSPPTQCVSASTSAFCRDHFADSASTSQCLSASSECVMYISWHCVPVPKYERTSAEKSSPGSVSRLCARFAKIIPCSISEFSGYSGPFATTFRNVSASR